MPSTGPLPYPNEQRRYRKFRSTFLLAVWRFAANLRVRLILAFERLSPTFNTFPPNQFLPLFYSYFGPLAVLPPARPELRVVVGGRYGPLV